MNIQDGSIRVDSTHRHIKIESETNPGTFHYVLVNSEMGAIEKCSCPSYANRPGVCKHIRAVINQRLLG